jgi:hypothetical protein
MKLSMETISGVRTTCLDNAVATVCNKHRGQKTDIKVYSQEILTLATEFERWFVRGLADSAPAAQPLKQTQQVQSAPAKPQDSQVAQDVSKSPMSDSIDEQRAVREQFAEDFAIEKFAPKKGGKPQVQQGLRFNLKK